MTKKQTNQQQFAAMVNFVKKLEDIAKEMMNGPEFKTTAKQMWDGVKEILNSLGPPIKTTDGWRKVWKDYKYHIKNKVRHNLKCIREEGEDSDKLITVSPLEEEVIALFNLKPSTNAERIKQLEIPCTQIQLAMVNDDEFVSSSGTPSEVEIKIESMSPDLSTNEYDDIDYDNWSILPSEDIRIIANEIHYDQPITHNPEVVAIKFEEVDVEPETRQRIRPPIKSTKRLFQLQMKKQNKFFVKTITLMEKQNKLLTRQNRELRLQTEEMKKSRRLQEQEVNLLKRQLELKEKENF